MRAQLFLIWHTAAHMWCLQYQTDPVSYTHLDVYKRQVYNDGGYELLGYADQGFRVMTTNKKIESLADFKGQKIRTMENSYHCLLYTSRCV